MPNYAYLPTQGGRIWGIPVTIQGLITGPRVSIEDVEVFADQHAVIAKALRETVRLRYLSMLQNCICYFACLPK